MSELSVLDGMTPSDFGLDEYQSFRRHPQTQAEVQLEVIEHLAYTDKRFACAAAPVGIGKSLIAMTLHKLLGVRTAIVVPFKGLEDQYARQMSRHLVDIRGRSNYGCGDYPHLDCKGGLSMGCQYIGGRGCAYEQAKDAAKNHQCLVTNYDYWLTVNDHAGGLQRNKDESDLFGENPIELLILDEGDEAPDKLAEYLAVRVSERDLARWIDPREMSEKDRDSGGGNIRIWQQLIDECKILTTLTSEIRTTGMEIVHKGKNVTKSHVEQLHTLERQLAKFERIRGMQPNDWVLDAKIGTRFGRQWDFDVVWPGRYAEQYLFCNIPKVVIMSGSLITKDLAWSGVRKDEYSYRQWARIFPAERQPIYICPPRRKDEKGELKSVMIQRNTSEEAKRYWVEWIDQIIDGRLDRKGLLQTSSYEYQKYIMEHSRHAHLMVGNTADPDSETAAEIAEQFYHMPAPMVLVSPSFARGWDFSYTRAEYTIISKCPFVPMQSKVIQARLERDELYTNHVTMKKVEQGAGRVMRAEDDRGEVFMTDGHFTYFIRNNRKLAQGWFADACRTVIEIPKAPPKLEEGGRS